MPPKKLCPCGSGKRARACCRTRLAVALERVRAGRPVPAAMRKNLKPHEQQALARAEGKGLR